MMPDSLNWNWDNPKCLLSAYQNEIESQLIRNGYLYSADWDEE